MFVSYTRAFTDRLQDTFGSIFEESDQAQAIKAFQQIDRSFNLEKFMKEAREYIVPELMDAYLKGDTETLKAWCSEAVSTSMTLGVSYTALYSSFPTFDLDLQRVDRCRSGPDTARLGQ